MNKKPILVPTILLLFMMAMLCSCDRKRADAGTTGSVPHEASVHTAEPLLPQAEAGTVEMLSDEQALSAIRSYCYTMNPDLENIVKAKEYPVYWDISSSNEQEIVVLFRSYTGAQNRYYIDRNTGDTYVTEFVPGITSEEQRSDERFNVRDYFSGD